MKQNEFNCGCQLLKLLLSVYAQKKLPASDENIARLLTIFDAVPAEKFNENKIIAETKVASTWSQTENSEHGSAKLHNLFASKYRQARVFSILRLFIYLFSSSTYCFFLFVCGRIFKRPIVITYVVPTQPVTLNLLQKYVSLSASWFVVFLNIFFFNRKWSTLVNATTERDLIFARAILQYV